MKNLISTLTTWLIKRNPVETLRISAHEARIQGHEVSLKVKPYGGKVEVL